MLTLRMSFKVSESVVTLNKNKNKNIKFREFTTESYDGGHSNSW